MTQNSHQPPDTSKNNLAGAAVIPPPCSEQHCRRHDCSQVWCAQGSPSQFRSPVLPAGSGLWWQYVCLNCSRCLGVDGLLRGHGAHPASHALPVAAKHFCGESVCGEQGFDCLQRSHTARTTACCNLCLTASSRPLRFPAKQLLKTSANAFCLRVEQKVLPPLIVR